MVSIMVSSVVDHGLGRALAVSNRRHVKLVFTVSSLRTHSLQLRSKSEKTGWLRIMQGNVSEWTFGSVSFHDSTYMSMSCQSLYMYTGILEWNFICTVYVYGIIQIKEYHWYSYYLLSFSFLVHEQWFQYWIHLFYIMYETYKQKSSDVHCGRFKSSNSSTVNREIFVASFFSRFTI